MHARREKNDGLNLNPFACENESHFPIFRENSNFHRKYIYSFCVLSCLGPFLTTFQKSHKRGLRSGPRASTNTKGDSKGVQTEPMDYKN